MVDEFTREALAVECERSITAEATVATLEHLVAERGAAPEHIRCDNGPELTAHALRDWCRLGSTATAYIEPGSPWQNPYVESFNARVRDEVLDVELFDTLAEARLILADWHAAYNAEHPHSALGMVAPARFAAAWRTQEAANGAARDASLREASEADITVHPDTHPTTLIEGGPTNGVRSLRRAYGLLSCSGEDALQAGLVRAEPAPGGHRSREAGAP